MNTPKHTHGPWISDKTGYPTDMKGNPVKTGGRSYEAHANARLIAAAPDMLEALSTVLLAFQNSDTLKNHAVGSALMEIMESAIAKARGE